MIPGILILILILILIPILTLTLTLIPANRPVVAAVVVGVLSMRSLQFNNLPSADCADYADETSSVYCESGGLIPVACGGVVRF